MKKLLALLLILALLTMPAFVLAQDDDDAENDAESEDMVELTLPEEDATIADILVANEDVFSTLIEALTAAELVETFQDEDATFTVFAPTNDAFDALPPGMLEGVLSSPPSLQAVLGYHVVDEALMAEDVVEEDMIMSLLGAPLMINATDDGVFINETVQVVVADVEATNGVIHVIDGVLMPERPGAEDMAEDAEDMSEDAAEAAEAAADAADDAEDMADDAEDDAEDMADDAEDDAEGMMMEEGPALDPIWTSVGGPFMMPEIDTADDFFVTVVDPFTDEELYGIEIINWTAEYTHTGFIVEEYLPAEVLIWMAEQDPSVWDDISVTTLTTISAEELEQLPEEVQAKAAE